MDPESLRNLLKAVSTGQVDPEAAAAELAAGPLGADGSGFRDLGYARVDTHRGIRTGDPEVVFGAGKTAAETVGIVDALRRASGVTRPTLVTRADHVTVAALRERWPDAQVSSGAEPPTTNQLAGSPLAGDRRPATVVVGPLPEPRGLVVVVAAGTSDAPVAEEAAMTAAAAGAGVEMVRDVGVAGLHRVLAARPALERADCLVVVAGMEGALPSVIGGLVGTPLVAVPTSVGYGASFGGLSALLGMLTSCAPGIVVCNIDNGFGAGLFAARVARLARSESTHR
ncbi:1-(5-phosphoribosyl)-5-amino-4-imidazole-carboxylate carboxylase [Frankia sp. R43]|uniref:nickel pincer cofactor biosynthesis protein LarB n=1 Tax=Frankia sp. R43 TaxID=269536 RepID=UPI0006CA5183|nr:nickel pincer cofactor biosynthesis protein LarB [Frankia sp. R43]KPM52964.1 1-(5-phosphoribosyl)-5-amino-4-imidazole-carboxylate carboxylase [Frankia sp. R43]